MKSFVSKFSLSLLLSFLSFANLLAQGEADSSALPAGAAVVSNGRVYGDDMKRRISLVRDSVARNTELSNYDRRRINSIALWASLAPTQLIYQYAGNMGFMSLGMGWDYGRHRRWETHWLLGFIRRSDGPKARMTMTMKETYTPWRLFEKERWSINPLTTGIYLNTVFGSDFWYRQPSRYPDAYYEYFSTKVRANVFLGPSLTYNFPNSGNQWARSVSFFCEASTCDFYIRSCVMGNGVAVKDVISLSLGAKVKFF